MARVYEGRAPLAQKILGPIERVFYKISGVDPNEEMTWKTYALAALAFNFFGIVAAYILQRIQHLLPLNPQNLGAVSPEVSFNTATSFGTNTNWQAYGGETTMSHLTQM